MDMQKKYNYVNKTHACTLNTLTYKHKHTNLESTRKFRLEMLCIFSYRIYPSTRFAECRTLAEADCFAFIMLVSYICM